MTMKRIYILLFTPLLLTSCNIADNIGLWGIVILFALMFILFGTMLFFIMKKKRQADKSLAKFSANIQQMLNKFDSTQEKIDTLKILIERINNDEQYKKDTTWRDQVLAKAYLFLATQYHNIGDEVQTLHTCTKIIELDPKDWMTYYNRGSLYSNMGMYEKALQDLNETIDLMPRYANAYNNRGLVYDKLGHHESAIEDYTQAIELEPTPIAYYNRANTYAEMNEYENALIDYRTFIDFDEDDDLGLKATVENEISILESKLKAGLH